MKVIVDANVCVSAVLSGRGSPARILDHTLSEGPYDFDLLAPSQLFPKLEDVLARPKIEKRLGWSEAEISTYVRRLKLFIQEIDVGDIEQVPHTPKTPKTTLTYTQPCLQERHTSQAATATSWTCRAPL